MLTHLGYDVVADVGDGQAALDIARKVRPDIVIMDIQMPEIDGITAAGILTSEQIAPVVLLTAYSISSWWSGPRTRGLWGIWSNRFGKPNCCQ
ncbi:MAG: response regulator [Thermomicrobiales bacterium]